jgi:hypothetical protein
VPRTNQIYSRLWIKIKTESHIWFLLIQTDWSDAQFKDDEGNLEYIASIHSQKNNTKHKTGTSTFFFRFYDDKQIILHFQRIQTRTQFD